MKQPNDRLNRRQMLGALAGAAVGVPLLNHTPLWGQSACSIITSPSLTEGPYFVDEDLNRPDIRFDADRSIQPGMPLSLAINVSKLVDCNPVPLTGAYVDIWHCNAAGVYSDVSAQSSTGRKFLRGYQPTDRHGNVYFLTIYPGWYQGRAVHIHTKVRVFDGLYQSYEFTSQFFMDEAFTDEVYRLAPYNTRGSRDTRNPTDSIYAGASSLAGVTSNSGSQLMLSLRNKGSWVEADARLILDLSLGSSPDQVPGGGGPGGPGVPGGPPPTGQLAG
jgi:protocatechuate 3,4-dioxygenase beta subunit